MSFKSLISDLLFKSNLFKITSPFYSGIGHILCFHRLVENQNGVRLQRPLSLEISRNDFNKMISYYKKNDFIFASMDDVADILEKKKTSKKFVALTFDDGYKDNFEIAYPILKNLGIPFTVYITTCFPDKTSLMWWYALEELILSNESISFELNGEEFIVNCIDNNEKNTSYSKIADLMQSWNNSELISFFKKFDINLVNYSDKIVMNWDEIKELSNYAFVGAHTISHKSLSQMTKEDALSEMTNSKKIIEQKINKVVSHFAYPFGGRAEAGIREFELAKEIGFRTAVTTRMANIFSAHYNYLHCLPRIGVDTKNLNLSLELISNGTLHFKKNKFDKLVVG
jgi:peptidoglycan/xylan/chitin deacetylase (PgdA/CDA1 family)